MASTDDTPKNTHPMLLWHLSERDRQTFKIDTSPFTDEVVELGLSWYHNILCQEYGGKSNLYSNDSKDFTKVFPLLVSIVLQLEDLIVFDYIVGKLTDYLRDNDIDSLCVTYAKKLIDHHHFFESVFVDDFFGTIVYLLLTDELREYLVDKLNNHPKGVYYVHRFLMLPGGERAFGLSGSWSNKIMNFKDKLAL